LIKERTPKTAVKRRKSSQAEKRPDNKGQCGEVRSTPDYGMGTDIANLFAGIGLRPGEEIKEWKGHSLNDPFAS
jgi:hypothetical protein